MSDHSATIAVLTDKYLDYRKVLVDQIAETAHESGYGTVCIAGRELNPMPDYHQDYTLCNSLYQHSATYNLCGVIALTGALATNTSQSHLQSFINRHFNNIPIISLGIDLPDITSVTIDEHNATIAMYEQALSGITGQRLAFIQGTPNDPYSIEREQKFRYVAQKHGISSENIISTPGLYNGVDSYNSIYALLEKDRSICVIAAANDLMAEHAIRAARAHGLRVPEDIRITGFDDTVEAIRIAPALSTVRQPTREAAALCTALLLERVHHPTTEPVSVSLKASFIERGSTQGGPPVTLKTAMHSQTALEYYLSHGTGASTGAHQKACQYLAEGLHQSLTSCSGNMQRCIEQSLDYVTISAASMYWWNNVCELINSLITPLKDHKTSLGTYAMITSVITGIRQQVGTIAIDEQSKSNRVSTLMSHMQLEMSACKVHKDITQTLDRWLRTTDIRRCYLVSYRSPGGYPDDNAELLHVYHQGEESQSVTTVFKTAALLPDEYSQILSKALLILNPVFANDTLFGYMLVEPSHNNHACLGYTAQSIGAAMRNQHLIERLEHQTRNLQSTNQELVKLANFDELTRLPNRLQFNTKLKACCKNVQKNNNKLALLFIDLDGFKLVNDTLGHRAGDELLRHVALRLEQSAHEKLGPNGFIARLSGDEFTVTLCPTTDQATTLATAENFLSALSKTYLIAEQNINISASIGIASFPDDAEDVESLIKHADIAMYKAKEKGKNRVAWYTRSLCVVSDTFLQIDSDMRIALQNGDISMHYQPRINMITGDMCALEALMRWTIKTPDGRKTRTRPDIFIPIAEKTGFISKLDIFALDESCRQARLWERAGTPILVAVNISVLHLQQDDFVDTVINTVKKHGLKPDLLELEITESAMMTQVHESVEKLNQLKQFGIQLSIDDFGTGYSSLSYLKMLPVDNLKIDRSFIADIKSHRMQRSADAAIVKSVIALGKSMDFQIIAEGIETEEQKEFLKSLGCHEAQGFLFARPGPAHHFEQDLARLHHIQKRA